MEQICWFVPCLSISHCNNFGGSRALTSIALLQVLCKYISSGRREAWLASRSALRAGWAEMLEGAGTSIPAAGGAGSYFQGHHPFAVRIYNLHFFFFDAAKRTATCTWSLPNPQPKRINCLDRIFHWCFWSVKYLTTWWHITCACILLTWAVPQFSMLGDYSQAWARLERLEINFPVDIKEPALVVFA